MNDFQANETRYETTELHTKRGVEWNAKATHPATRLIGYGLGATEAEARKAAATDLNRKIFSGRTETR